MLTPAHLEIYVKIKSDPHRRLGFRIDDSIAFCELVDRRLAKLNSLERNVLFMRAYGYTQVEVAEYFGVSLRTMNRRYRVLDNKVFEKYLMIKRQILYRE
jgi:hypothetical protein